MTIEEPSGVTCVNCDSPVEYLTVCDGCGCDPLLPRDQRDAVVASGGVQVADTASSVLQSPEEHRALIVACLVSGTLGVAFAGLTLGLFVLLVAVAISQLYFARSEALVSLVRTSPDSFPVVDSVAKTAAYRLNMPKIDVFIRQSPNLNAFASGLGRRSWIVLESALVDALTTGELLFVLGHELGHVKRRHVLWQVLVGRTDRARIPIVTRCFELVFSSWSREAEYTADKAGFLAVGHVRPCCSALIKIVAGPDAAAQVTPAEHIETMDAQGELENAVAEIFRSHPLAGNRMRGLLAFAQQLGQPVI